MTLLEYSDVRILRLLQPATSYDPWRLNVRPPCIGDVGTIVEVRRSSGLPDTYVVENSGSDGVAIWLAVFLPEELGPVAAAAPSVPDRLHIIITRTDVLLSRQSYPDWRAIQAAVPEYVASLGPWAPEEVVSYLQLEWSGLEPSASSQVQSFLSGGVSETRLTFRTPASIG